LLKKFKLDGVKEISTTMYPTTSLRLEKELRPVDNILHRHMIASLLYLLFDGFLRNYTRWTCHSELLDVSSVW